MNKENDIQDIDELNESATMNEEVDVDTNAGDSTPEETLAAYEELFAKQKAELDRQMTVNNNLQKQINILMRNGASITEAKAEVDSIYHQEDEEAQEPYVSLCDLGLEIGKRDYKYHNTKRE